MSAKKGTLGSDPPLYTLGGETYVKVNVQTSCASTEACVDISVLVFLVVVLSLAIIGLIGVNKIFQWLCCDFCFIMPRQVRE